ncbi:hypothetical protein QNE38_001381 [Vibrio fluvialis]|nr:hypothetical protein [Vibrio fluvialis]
MKKLIALSIIAASIALTGCQVTKTYDPDDIVNVQTLENHPENQSQVMLVEYSDGVMELVIHQTANANSKNAKDIKLAMSKQTSRGKLKQMICSNATKEAEGQIEKAGYTVEEVPVIRFHIEDFKGTDIINVTCNI